MYIILLDNLMEAKIDELDLSTRSYNSLKRAGVNTIADFYDRNGEAKDINRIRNLGTKSKDEIGAKLFKYNFESLEDDNPNVQVRYLKAMALVNMMKGTFDEFKTFVEGNFNVNKI